MNNSRRPGMSLPGAQVLLGKTWIPAKLLAGMTALLLFCVFPIYSAEIALIYENEAAVKAGKFSVTSLVQEGALVSAKLAMANGGKLLIGPLGSSLYASSLVRLDNDLDIAVMRLAEPVADKTLQDLHQKKAQAVQGFLPNSNSPSALVPAASVSPEMLLASGPVAIKLEGQVVDGQSFELKSNSLKKAKVKLEVVVTSTIPVWSVSIELKSNPKLGFWKEGRRSSANLNDIPKNTFKYDYQVMMVPLKNGKAFPVKVEVHYIEKAKPYVWDFKIKTKQGELTKTANVVFK